MSAMDANRPMSRRALLTGGAAGGPMLRPPWAHEAAEFASRCTGCDACIQACPESVLSRDPDGRPRFDPQAGECTFCGDCVRACTPAALEFAATTRWPWRARVEPGCLPAHGVVCASCRDVCPEAAIRVPPGGRGAASIDPLRCTGCSACIGVCPAGAIALERPPLEEAA